MEFLSDLHTHTSYSDGADSPEQMLKAAITRGFGSIGFSEHAPASYDAECQINPARLPEYFAEINRLKQKYAGEIEIYLGMESDALCPFDKEGLDYTIGSVHYLRDAESGSIYSVDYLERDFLEAVRVIGRGSVKTLVTAFYKTTSEMLDIYRPDIAGHVDSIVKLNGDGHLFDENSAWYKKLQDDIAGQIAGCGCIVEVNTGGMRRGYRKTPYPSEYMLNALHALNVPVTLSSDAHNADSLGFCFPKTLEMLKKIGFKSLRQLRGGVFADMEIIN